MHVDNLICTPTKKPVFSGKISRKILDGVKEDKYDSVAIYGVSIEEFVQLHKLYKEKLGEIPHKLGQPRYLHFYHILKDKIPQINWSVSYRRNKPIVKISPSITVRPSLASILLNRVLLISKSRLYAQEVIRVLKHDFTDAINQFINTTQAICPSNERAIHNLISWIKSAQTGQNSTISIQICPDYASKLINKSKQIYKHTFESLGCGIGQIANRIINTLPELKQLLNILQIAPNVIVTIADYEAFSLAKRMNLTKDDFLDRVNKSRLSFEEAANSIMPVKVFMVTDLCNGEKVWLAKVDQILEDLSNGNIGNSNINKNLFIKIAKSRRSLYKNWFSVVNGNLEEYIATAMKQAAEYIAIGFYITNKFNNCLILGADSIDFTSFYSFYKPVPSLYLKQFYC